MTLPLTDYIFGHQMIFPRRCSVWDNHSDFLDNSNLDIFYHPDHLDDPQVCEHHHQLGSHFPEWGSCCQPWRPCSRAILSHCSGDLTISIMVITMIVVMMQPSIFTIMMMSSEVMMQPRIFTIMMMISQGPYRHYVLNLLWILINVLCLALTIYHLNKLYRCNKHWRFWRCWPGWWFSP